MVHRRSQLLQQLPTRVVSRPPSVHAIAMLRGAFEFQTAWPIQHFRFVHYLLPFSRTARPITHFGFVYLVNEFPLALPAADNNIDPLPSGP